MSTLGPGSRVLCAPCHSHAAICAFQLAFLIVQSNKLIKQTFCFPFPMTLRTLALTQNRFSRIRIQQLIDKCIVQNIKTKLINLCAARRLC